jgi:hypothetical protein
MIEIKIPGIDEPIDISGDNNRFVFEYCEQYSPPDLSYKLLRSWVEHFGTEQIDTSDHISQKGCETCDYGSRYGFRIIIEGATKNLPYQPK